MTISHLDGTAQIPQERWYRRVETFKLLPSVCAVAGLDTKAPLAASYKASGYFIPAIMEKISFFQGQGMAAMGKFGGGYLCRARGTFLIVLQAFVN